MLNAHKIGLEHFISLYQCHIVFKYVKEYCSSSHLLVLHVIALYCGRSPPSSDTTESSLAPPDQLAKIIRNSIAYHIYVLEYRHSQIDQKPHPGQNFPKGLDTIPPAHRLQMLAVKVFFFGHMLYINILNVISGLYIAYSTHLVHITCAT